MTLGSEGVPFPVRSNEKIMTFDYTHFPVVLLGSQTAKLYMLGKSALFFYGVCRSPQLTLSNKASINK